MRKRKKGRLKRMTEWQYKRFTWRMAMPRAGLTEPLAVLFQSKSV
jgi:hypothetical protein